MVAVAVVAVLLGGEVSRRRRGLRFEAAAAKWARNETRSKLLADMSKMLAEGELFKQQNKEDEARVHRDLARGREFMRAEREKKAEGLDREAAACASKASMLRREQEQDQEAVVRAGMLARRYAFAARFPLLPVWAVPPEPRRDKSSVMVWVD